MENLEHRQIKGQVCPKEAEVEMVREKGIPNSDLRLGRPEGLLKNQRGDLEEDRREENHKQN